MGQSADLVLALKTELRARKITYRQIAAELGVAESSVKRMFASGHLTLARLDAICEFAEIDYGSLVRGRVNADKLLTRLTAEQESELIAEPHMFLVAVSLMNLITYDDILATYTLSEAEVVGYMARLDRVGFIKLLPNNRYKLLLARTFGWLPNGPMMQLFKDNAGDFFASDFGGPDEMLVVVNARLSPMHISAFMDRIRRLARDFSEQHIEDATLPLDERPPLSLLIAARPWHMRFMTQLLKKPKPSTGVVRRVK